MNQKAFLIFSIDDLLYALSVMDVKHIIRSVAITPLSDAPDLMTGILNMGGSFIPVIDIRRQFNLSPKALQVSDRFIIADVCGYTIAFIVDTIESVVELSKEPLSKDLLPSDIVSSNLFPDIEKFIVGVSQFNNRTVLIYDINTLFPEQEIRLATEALTTSQIEEPA